MVDETRIISRESSASQRHSSRGTVPAGEEWAFIGLPETGACNVYVAPGAGGTADIELTSSGTAAIVAGTELRTPHPDGQISSALRNKLDCEGIDAVIVTANTQPAAVEISF